jgi:hypothetical protein
MLDSQGIRPRGVQAKGSDGRKLWTEDGQPVVTYGPWNEGSVRQVITNMTYAGRRMAKDGSGPGHANVAAL